VFEQALDGAVTVIGYLFLYVLLLYIVGYSQALSEGFCRSFPAYVWCVQSCFRDMSFVLPFLSLRELGNQYKPYFRAHALT
jgi:hypothetical protein